MDGNKALLEKVTPMEVACCRASKFCENDTTAFVGVGLSLLPAQIAQKTHAPDLIIVYEGGNIGSTPVGRVPWGVDDTVVQANADCQTDLVTTLGCMAQTGRVDLTLLGAAQVDKYGNSNATLRGSDFNNPVARVSGSGGAHDLAVGSKAYILIMNHAPDRVTEKIDYRTTPGFCEGGRSRWDVWNLPGGGPVAIITDLAVMMPNPVTYELEIAEVHPFTTIEEVKSKTGFDIKVAKDVKVTELPTEEETKIIREQIDISGDFTGWTKLFKDNK